MDVHRKLCWLCICAFWLYFAAVNGDPVSYQEALKATDKSEWMEAINSELESMSKNQVWKLVDRKTASSDGKRQNVIDSRWVLKKKIEPGGNIRYKTRLVIRGFKDKNEYDLQETYAPVSRLPLIRMTLTIANKFDLELCQMDVKTAFFKWLSECSSVHEDSRGSRMVD